MILSTLLGVLLSNSSFANKGGNATFVLECGGILNRNIKLVDELENPSATIAFKKIYYPIEKKIKNQEERTRAALDIVEKIKESVSNNTILYPYLKKLIVLELDSIIPRTSIINKNDFPGTTLEKDFYTDVSLEDNCSNSQWVPVANWDDSFNTLIIRESYYNKLNPYQIALLYTHEVLYKIGRMIFGIESSLPIRNLTAAVPLDYNQVESQLSSYSKELIKEVSNMVKGKSHLVNSTWSKQIEQVNLKQLLNKITGARINGEYGQNFTGFGVNYLRDVKLNITNNLDIEINFESVIPFANNNIEDILLIEEVFAFKLGANFNNPSKNERNTKYYAVTSIDYTKKIVKTNFTNQDLKKKVDLFVGLFDKENDRLIFSSQQASYESY